MLCLIMLKYYFVLHIKMQCQLIIEPIHNTTNQIKRIKNRNQNIEQSELSKTLQDQLNEFILPKRLQDATLHLLYVKKLKDR